MKPTIKKQKNCSLSIPSFITGILINDESVYLLDCYDNNRYSLIMDCLKDNSIVYTELDLCNKEFNIKLKKESGEFIFYVKNEEFDNPEKYYKLNDINLNKSSIVDILYNCKNDSGNFINKFQVVVDNINNDVISFVNSEENSDVYNSISINSAASLIKDGIIKREKLSVGCRYFSIDLKEYVYLGKAKNLKCGSQYDSSLEEEPTGNAILMIEYDPSLKGKAIKEILSNFSYRFIEFKSSNFFKKDKILDTSDYNEKDSWVDNYDLDSIVTIDDLCEFFNRISYDKYESLCNINTDQLKEKIVKIFLDNKDKWDCKMTEEYFPYFLSKFYNKNVDYYRIASIKLLLNITNIVKDINDKLNEEIGEIDSLEKFSLFDNILFRIGETRRFRIMMVNYYCSPMFSSGKSIASYEKAKDHIDKCIDRILDNKDVTSISQFVKGDLDRYCLKYLIQKMFKEFLVNEKVTKSGTKKFGKIHIYNHCVDLSIDLNNIIDFLNYTNEIDDSMKKKIEMVILKYKINYINLYDNFY